MGYGVIKYRLVVLGILATQFVFAGEFTGVLDTSFGRNLSPELPATSFSFEPELAYTWSKVNHVALYTYVDRPTDVYEKLTVPKTILSASREFPVGLITLIPTLSVNFVSLDRWGIDGYQLRNSATLIGKYTSGGLTLKLRGGMYGMTTEYKSLADGARTALFGFIQRADLSYEYGRLFIEAMLAIDQRHNGAVWINDYATVEAIGYKITDSISLALNHSILSSVIEASTGFRAPLRFGDGRDSRVGVTLEVG
ncbi:MAG: hypothetical protein HYR96_01545, partial [Deltaproteobacteria bacterium]|nr:hypothetical protein [Deltaproteobacteria bacterium]